MRKVCGRQECVISWLIFALSAFLAYYTLWLVPLKEKRKRGYGMMDEKGLKVLRQSLKDWDWVGRIERKEENIHQILEECVMLAFILAGLRDVCFYGRLAVKIDPNTLEYDSHLMSIDSAQIAKKCGLRVDIDREVIVARDEGALRKMIRILDNGSDVRPVLYEHPQERKKLYALMGYPECCTNRFVDGHSQPLYDFLEEHGKDDLAFCLCLPSSPSLSPCSPRCPEIHSWTKKQMEVLRTWLPNVSGFLRFHWVHYDESLTNEVGALIAQNKPFVHLMDQSEAAYDDITSRYLKILTSRDP